MWSFSAMIFQGAGSGNGRLCDRLETGISELRLLMGVFFRCRHPSGTGFQSQFAHLREETSGPPLPKLNITAALRFLFPRFPLAIFSHPLLWRGRLRAKETVCGLLELQTHSPLQHAGSSKSKKP